MVRNYDEREVLSQHSDAVAVLKLHGYVFFGSTLQILDSVKRQVMILDRSVVNEAPHHMEASAAVASDLRSLAGGMQHTGRPTQYLVLDMHNVTGLDATAARSVFLVLRQLCKAHEITLLLCAVQPSVERILRANGILETDVQVFESPLN